MHVPLWQSQAWKKYQEALGKEVRIYEEGDAHALVSIDRTLGGFCTWDIPRGPIGKHREKLLERIIQDAKKEQCFSLYFSPEEPVQVTNYKLQISSRHEQPEATRMIDLTQSEEEILAHMKPKGRYNIRVAEKHGVTVRESNDVDMFYALLQETGGRDGFRIKPKEEYQTFLEKLPGSFLLIASIPLPCPRKGAWPPRGFTPSLREGNPAGETRERAIAGLIGVIYEHTGYYYYGASSYAHRALMAPYLLQWEAMKRCKRQGCEKYDLFGIAPPETPGHPWTSVSQFKEKFGGEVVVYPKEQEIVLRPVIKALLTFKRKIF